ncbi:MAG: hypothetical protein KAV87_66275 [Desulfobacteraceae bacterium]|nr:hypothetical protein [Desulfobacteraceae bacterium]
MASEEHAGYGDALRARLKKLDCQADYDRWYGDNWSRDPELRKQFESDLTNAISGKGSAFCAV